MIFQFSNNKFVTGVSLSIGVPEARLHGFYIVFWF